MREAPRGGAQRPVRRGTRCGSATPPRPTGRQAGARVRAQRRARRRRRGARAGTSRSRPAASRPTAASATGSSTTSTRSTSKARRASSPRPCRSRTTRATSTAASRGTGRSWMLVARAARRARRGAACSRRSNRVFLQFWRHQLAYYHPSDNCTSIASTRCARSGWTCRARTDVALLVRGSRFPCRCAKERSVAKARSRSTTSSPNGRACCRRWRSRRCSRA